MNTLPHFTDIDYKETLNDLEEYLENNLNKITELTQQKELTWDNLITPLEELSAQIDAIWSPISHLHAVMNNEEIRHVYKEGLAKLTDYGTELGQSEPLFKAFEALHQSEEFPRFNKAQQKVITDGLRDFQLSGVALQKDEKQIFKKIQKDLAQLTNQFSQNVLDATDAWTKLITDEKELAGLPEHAIQAAKDAAERKNQKGWLLTLEFPSFHPVMTYADNRKLREEIYTAYVTRASDKGPHANQWDNTSIMEQILKLRLEESKLLGFKHYTEYSLATKMAHDLDEVTTFLEQLLNKSKPIAEKEMEELKTFAKEIGCHELQAWDVAYYSEKLRQEKHQLTEEDLRPYFQEDKVIKGMFHLVDILFGVKLHEIKHANKWHDDVRVFELNDHDGETKGFLYVDLYARANKRGGAWMDECQVQRRRANGEMVLPIAYLTCNFSGPTKETPSLLTHEEVLTLFHEFGHCLHHLLTKVEYYDVSGINGVEWDAVELPSQFMENFCWDKAILDMISSHYQTDEPLPDDLYRHMIGAKFFQTGMQMVRQLEFSLFDIRLHTEYNPEKENGQIQMILDDVRSKTSVLPIAPFNRFQHGFSHIFAGGYAAGYYSYKWAEVLSSDAFSLFEEKGLLDQSTGRRFLHEILERGGSYPAKELFQNFRGRPPEIDALLRHSGLALLR